MISIQNLSASYDSTSVLEGFNLNLKTGESYALIGPSGCGKSTLLKILAGIHKEYSGQILYNSKNIFSHPIKIGYVPQTFGLLDWKTVRENICLPLMIAGTAKISTEDFNEIVLSLDIEDLLLRYPQQLSGGQRQRVALARTFLSKPDLMLMDEPFSSLDSFTSLRSQELCLKLLRKNNITTLFITHNIHEAINICKHILLMGKNTRNIEKYIENTTIDTTDRIEKLKLANEVLELFEILDKQN